MSLSVKMLIAITENYTSFLLSIVAFVLNLSLLTLQHTGKCISKSSYSTFYFYLTRPKFVNIYSVK